MAKKKAKKVAKKETKKARVTCIAFLRALYKGDKLISNDKALSLLKAKFPKSKANSKAITTWKNMLRAEGIDIPKGKANSKKKKVSKKKKKRIKK